MPFNDTLFSSPATKGDAAGPAIFSSLAVSIIIVALRALKNGDDAAFEKALKDLDKVGDDLGEHFRSLTGYRDK